MHGRAEDVRGRLAVELLDPLAEVGLDRPTPASASASLSLISSVAIDFDFTASGAAAAREARM